ncbi:MAG: DUF3035 domain-containing protein [Alphaproteobacteria bacterium]
MIRMDGRRLTASGRTAVVVVLGLALAACSNIKQQIGIGKTAPDEFNVVIRAPLSLPPDYSLRPPTPGENRPQEAAVQDRAKAALYGAASKRRAAGEPNSAGERALLALADAGRARPDIRRIINEENALFAEDDSSFVDRLMFWQTQPPPGTLVDPTKEAQRLQEASALGKPPTEGETPIIERRKKAILEGIF